MTRGVNEINEMILPQQRDRAGFHGNPAVLFVETIIEYSKLSSLFFVDDVVGGQQTVCEGGFAVVDVGDDGDVADARGVWK